MYDKRLDYHQNRLSGIVSQLFRGGFLGRLPLFRRGGPIFLAFITEKGIYRPAVSSIIRGRKRTGPLTENHHGKWHDFHSSEGGKRPVTGAIRRFHPETAGTHPAASPAGAMCASLMLLAIRIAVFLSAWCWTTGSSTMG